MRIIVPVNKYPFNNYKFRYLKLLDAISNKYEVNVFALRLGKIENPITYRVVRTLPPFRPVRISYWIYSYVVQTIANVLSFDLVWLFDFIPTTPLLFKKPIILDIDDPRVTLPPEMKSRVPHNLLISELRLLRSKKVVKIVVMTEIIKKKLVKLGVDENKLEVIPYGVDLNLFRYTPLPERPVVLYYGSFQPHRARLLLKVVEKLAKVKKDIDFILIGNIPKPVRRWLANMLGERVVMPGYIPHDHLPYWLQKARVCLLPQDKSLGGRLSFKLLEYMASGRPVVTTDVDEAFPIKESQAGLVVPIDANTFAEAVVTLLEDNRLALQMSERGVEYARKFDWNKMVRRYLNLFKNVSKEQL
ncbi:MAG: glycosyltransferase family 4 protein [Candidatus Caldarchaeum sp.]|jgi:glycosyltransferase involved in cell wall biosynthesis